MKLLSKILLFGIACFIWHSCAEDVVETDPQLIPYFDLFAQEAASRGFTVDYEAERIEGLIEDISQGNVLGQCFRNEKKPKKVVIDRTYWEGATEDEREFLIFHELGHCFLDREHDDRRDRDGFCLSIMHSTPQVCTFDLTVTDWDAYLDELFN